MDCHRRIGGCCDYFPSCDRCEGQRLCFFASMDNPYDCRLLVLGTASVEKARPEGDEYIEAKEIHSRSIDVILRTTYVEVYVGRSV